MRALKQVAMAALAAGLLWQAAGCGMSVNKSVVLATGTKHQSGYSTVNGAIKVGDQVTFSSGDLNTVNGSVSVGANCTVFDLASVNGSIKVGDGTTAAEVETVNGAVAIGEGVKAASLESVNGSISIGARSAVKNEVETVNGGVTLHPGSSVGGNVASVNGLLSFEAATVGGNIQNTNGGMTLQNGTVVDGNLTVKKPSKPASKKPVVIIGRDCEVKGSLTFEQPVDLHVHDTAKVGPITGAQPKSFSGDAPAGA